MNRSIFHLTGVTLVILGFTVAANGACPNGVRAVAHVVGQKNYPGDAYGFSVCLDLKIEVINSSRKPVYLRSDLIPLEDKIATSMEAAKSRKYLPAPLNSGSVYLRGDEIIQVHLKKVGPGCSVVIPISHCVSARYDAAFDVPQLPLPGTYALQLVFGPTYIWKHSYIRGLIDSLTTEPFLFEVPQRVSPGNPSEQKH